MLVGDIYGGRDYHTIGLDSTTIASSFGKVVGQVSHPPLRLRVMLRDWLFPSR
jgi:pantothenate kinase